MKYKSIMLLDHLFKLMVSKCKS